MSVQPLLSGFGPWKSGPCMDWKETPEAHVYKFDLPGLTKEDMKLQVHGDRVLHVSAQTKQDEDYGPYKWHRKERVDAGGFLREFRLPENVVVDGITASMSDGVLVVRVAKDGSKKNKNGLKKRAVEIDGEDDSGPPKGLSRFVCCKA